jgi:ketosteroid isomerase-like protein
MRRQNFVVGALVTFGLLTAGLLLSGRVGEPPAARADEPKADDDKDREADREAAAAHGKEKGEYQDETSEPVRGRAAIEAAFAEFFKGKPKSKFEVRISSIRFPAADTAIEEGLLRHIPDGKGLPTSTEYSAIHVREKGKWKIAVSREWGAGQDRLEDLDWLIGTWKGGGNGQETVMSFERNEQRGCIVEHFTQKAKGKVVSSGMVRIAMDPQHGQLRSWHFDDSGGHGQSLWSRDGNRWVLEAIGVMGDGSDSESVNILVRTGPDTITWQSIDREVDGDSLPDTAPVRLTREKQAK